MNTDKIILKMDNKFRGTLNSPTSEINIGSGEGNLLPYHMLYGALGSCFYATFISLARKMKLEFGDCLVEITGNKRAEAPATLEDVYIKFTISNPSDEKKLIRAAELGAKYCSIYETISKVANMHLEVLFNV